MALASDIAAIMALAFQACGEVRVAFVFGSMAVGGTWSESDLDIAVRWDKCFDANQRLDAHLKLIESLTDVLGPLGEKADIADIDRVSSAVAFRAIRDGVCVYAKSEAERVDAVVDICRRYDDDAASRELFRQAASAAVARLKAHTHG